MSTWAREQGISYKTAWRLCKAGKLAVPAEQLASGTVIIHVPPANEPPRGGLVRQSFLRGPYSGLA